MPRTTEQIAADNQLTEAIDTVLRAYRDQSEPCGVLSTYLVLAVRKEFDGDGDVMATNYAHPRDGSRPVYELLGIVEHAATVYRTMISTSDRSGEE